MNMKMPRKSWIVLSLVLTTYLAHVFWPWISFYSEGDKCTFGYVSNQEYRKYLAQAKQLSKSKWKNPSSWNGKAGSIEITKRIDEMTKDESSFYKTIAKTHAVVRAMGGQYFSGSWAYTTGGPKKDPEYWHKRNARNPPVPIEQRRTIVFYSYGFDPLSRRFYLTRPFSFGLKVNIFVGQDLGRQLGSDAYRANPELWTENKFLFNTVLTTDGLKGAPFTRRIRSASPVGGHCPRLPTQNWLENYFQFQANLKPGNNFGVTKP